MTKEKYKQIRNKNNFIYLFYIHSEGKIRDESIFNSYFKKWLMSQGIRPDVGIIQIKQRLDKKYQYVG